MKMINIHEAKARLSEYLELVERGERVVICRRNEPIAELRPVTAARTEPRPLGGTPLTIPPAFFAPLPEAEVDAFYGDSADRPAKGAERRANYRPERQPRS